MSRLPRSTAIPYRFVFHAWLHAVPVLQICDKDPVSVNRNVTESSYPCWIQPYLFWFWSIQCFWASGFDSVSILFLTMICSVLDEGSLNQASQIWFRCSFFCLDWINVWFLALILLAMFCIYYLLRFSRRLSELCCSLDLKISSPDFESIIFVYFFFSSFCLFFYLFVSQSATDCADYDIGHYKCMSRHSVVIVDFDEVAEHAQLALFFWYTF